YIRIIRIEHHDSSDLIDDIIHLINPKVSQQAAIDVVKRLYENKIITRREEYLMVSVMDREVLAYPLSDRDILRARILTAMLTAIKYAKKEKREVEKGNVWNAMKVLPHFIKITVLMCTQRHNMFSRTAGY